MRSVRTRVSRDNATRRDGTTTRPVFGGFSRPARPTLNLGRRKRSTTTCSRPPPPPRRSRRCGKKRGAAKKFELTVCGITASFTRSPRIVFRLSCAIDRCPAQCSKVTSNNDIITLRYSLVVVFFFFFRIRYDPAASRNDYREATKIGLCSEILLQS